MYDRPDVPKGGRNTTKIAVAVLVAIAIALAVLVSTLWRLANEHTKLGDSKLSDAAAASTASQDGLAALAEASGLTVTGDDLTTVLFAVVDDADDAKLDELALVALDGTKSSASAVYLPVDARLSTGNSLASAYAASGAEGLVKNELVPAGVPVTHVVVMTKTGWETLKSAAQEGASVLARKARDLIGGIERSDMAAQDFVSLAQRANSAGMSLSAIETAAAADGADESGSYRQIDRVDLLTKIGVLASAA